MSTQEVIDGNKLIAEFDSQMMLFDETDPKRESWVRNKMWVHLKDLKYHSSWDWLMPVVEKIEKETTFLVSIAGYVCDITDEPPFEKDNIRCKNDIKIIATWQAVIQFIQFFKTQTQPQ